jgi:uncharacterized protein YgiM (DUF1202 family)
MFRSRASTAAAVMCLLAAAAIAAGAKQMSVQYRTSELRSEPSRLSDPVATVNYADQLTIVEQKGAWYQVTTADGKTGWIHSSALTKQTLKLASGGGDTEMKVSSDEAGKATKRFDKATEMKYQQAHGDAGFKWVDLAETIRVSVEEMKAFIKEGGLEVKEGGAQ